MKEDFDFNRIGKRLPYTTPDSFLDDIEKQRMGNCKNRRCSLLDPNATFVFGIL